MENCGLLQDCEGPFYCCKSCKNHTCKNCIIQIIKNKICNVQTSINEIPCPYCRMHIDIEYCKKSFGEEIIKKMEIQHDIYKFCNSADFDYIINEALILCGEIIKPIYDCGVTFEMEYVKTINFAHLKSQVVSLSEIYNEITKIIE
jgi:hypothetical protein